MKIFGFGRSKEPGQPAPVRVPEELTNQSEIVAHVNEVERDLEQMHRQHQKPVVRPVEDPNAERNYLRRMINGGLVAAKRDAAACARAKHAAAKANRRQEAIFAEHLEKSGFSGEFEYETADPGKV